MDWTRLFIVLIPQSITIISFGFIAYKILMRRKDRSSVLLSSFYLALVFAFSINLIALYLIYSDSQLNTLITLLYFIVTYLILFGFFFLVLFIINLYFVNTIFNLKITMLILSLSGISSIIILVQPEGITLSEDFLVQYSIELLISLYIFIFLAIVIPSLILTIKVLQKIHHHSLKKKFKLFAIGLIVKYFDLYGAILYNTWHFQLYRSIWSGITSFLLIASALLIYYGVGKNLSSVNLK